MFRKHTWIHKMNESFGKHKAVILSITGFSLIVTLVTNHIPYVNLYANEFITAVLVAEWLFITFRYRLTFQGNLKFLIFLLILSFFLTVLNQQRFAEIIGNIIYVIFLIALVKEFVILNFKRT